jgi:hypothetical protein
MNKMILTLLITITLGVALIFYVALHNKTQDVSNQEPYIYFLKSEFITTTEVIIIENTSLPGVKAEYPKEISDVNKIDTSRVEHLILPTGSSITFTKAVHFTNATSGMKYAMLFGKVSLKNMNSEMNVIYVWGKFKTLCLDEPCNYWEYDRGFWEK